MCGVGATGGVVRFAVLSVAPTFGSIEVAIPTGAKLIGVHAGSTLTADASLRHSLSLPTVQQRMPMEMQQPLIAYTN